MADFTDGDRQKASQIVAQMFVDGGGATAAGFAATESALPDPKTLFCQNWSTVKSVLQALKLLLPKFSWLLDLLIAAGDKLHQATGPG